MNDAFGVIKTKITDVIDNLASETLTNVKNSYFTIDEKELWT
jgi:hypothetical protein